jgi:cytochrome c oxidase accessory protein FixG
MTDASEPIQYFVKEPKVYPKRIGGRYRQLKWASMSIMLAIYYLAPFLRWDRGPNAPDQAILIDMVNRRGYFFFIEIWPQEVYYLTGILILAAVALFFVTSLAGRVWCGYACPQTVWTDLFVWVERFVQGDRNARKKLDDGPWGFKKLYQKAATHALWLVIGALTGGAWVFYFNDAPTLLEQIIHLDVPWSVLSWIIALTLSTYVMAGFARQQVCKYMCPYARFQSAMFDRDTLIIGYDEKRGEPRGKFKEKEEKGYGDCIDCSLCVQVCPVGIDIREGLQYECIACGLCVDACNGVMDKTGQERGLIRYDTTVNQELRDAGKAPPTVWAHIFRARTYYYGAIMAVIGGIMLYSLLTRAPLELHILHDRNPLFVKLSDGSIRNGYDVKILNKTHEDREYKLSITGLENANLVMQGAGEIDPESLFVFADSVGHFRLFVSAEKQTQERQQISFAIEESETRIQDDIDSVFISAR